MRNGAFSLAGWSGVFSKTRLPYLIAPNLALSSEHKRQIPQSTMACLICNYLISWLSLRCTSKFKGFFVSYTLRCLMSFCQGQQFSSARLMDTLPMRVPAFQAFVRYDIMSTSANFLMIRYSKVFKLALSTRVFKIECCRWLRLVVDD